MLSAAGINNIQSRVRVKRNPPRRSSSSTDDTREYPPDTKENQMRGSSAHRRPSSATLGSNGPSNAHTNNSNNEPRQRRIRSISRPRLKTDRIHEGIVEMKQRSRNRVESMKERSRNSMDGMKEKSRNGVDRVKKVVPKKPHIRLKPVSRPLPSRSLFQHKPRTWYGTKQKDPNKVKEQDWRNDRPETPKKKKEKKSSSSREEEYQEVLLLKRKESRSSQVTEEHREDKTIPLKKGSRTRSGSSRVSASEEYEWKQYIVQ